MARDYVVIAGLDLAALVLSLWAQLSAEYIIGIVLAVNFIARLTLR